MDNEISLICGVLDTLGKRLATVETKLAKKSPRPRRRPTVSFELDVTYANELDAIVAKYKLNCRSALMRLIIKEWLYTHQNNHFSDISLASDVNEIIFR
jgi:hypothetical protein